MGTQIAVGSGIEWGFRLTGTPAWFAVHTSSRHEKQVAQQLAGREIEHLLPLYQQTSCWADRRTVVEMPLFPGYLFVRIVPGQRREVVQVPGVARIVGFHGAPVAVEDAEIEALRNALRAGIRVSPHEYLRVGSRVRVRSGALCGVEGILLRKKDGDRIVVSVDLIMKSVAMEIDAADVDEIAR
jgi:transcription termination/antitermination protein NusG